MEHGKYAERGGRDLGRGRRYREMVKLPCDHDNVSQERIEQDKGLDVEDNRFSPLPVWRAGATGSILHNTN